MSNYTVTHSIRGVLKYEYIEVFLEGKPVGELATCPHNDFVWLVSLVVLPGYWRRGIGRILLQELLWKYEGTEIRLRADPYGEGAMELSKLVRFYESFGFVMYDDKNRMMRPAS